VVEVGRTFRSVHRSSKGSRTRNIVESPLTPHLNMLKR